MITDLPVSGLLKIESVSEPNKIIGGRFSRGLVESEITIYNKSSYLIMIRYLLYTFNLNIMLYQLGLKIKC